MKAVKARITRGLLHGSWIDTCDNSGAKRIKLISVKHLKTTKGRVDSAGIGDLIQGSVVRGKPEMRKQVVFAIIVRQRRPYRRPDGTWIRFEDNAVVVLKDDLGNPKGTMLKGPIAKEACDRWPAVAKIATLIV